MNVNLVINIIKVYLISKLYIVTIKIRIRKDYIRLK